MHHHDQSVRTTTNFASIPREVYQQHILCLLPACSVVACCMVDKYLRNRSSCLLVPKNDEQQGKQRAILNSLFEAGVSIDFMEWFQKYLRYPVFLKPSAAPTRLQQQRFEKCLSLAAKGIQKKDINK